MRHLQGEAAAMQRSPILIWPVRSSFDTWKLEPSGPLSSAQGWHESRISIASFDDDRGVQCVKAHSQRLRQGNPLRPRFFEHTVMIHPLHLVVPTVPTAMLVPASGVRTRKQQTRMKPNSSPGPSESSRKNENLAARTALEVAFCLRIFIQWSISTAASGHQVWPGGPRSSVREE
ncbi:hypothetical protein BJX65DRAFT_120443 [Aspergillus insuetus]